MPAATRINIRAPRRLRGILAALAIVGACVLVMALPASAYVDVTTTTGMTVDSTSVLAGATSTFTVTVTAQGGAVAPQGAVQLYDGSTAIATGTLTPGSGLSSTVVIQAKLVGVSTHSLYAVYSGKDLTLPDKSIETFESSQSSNVGVVVASATPPKSDTTITLTADKTEITQGDKAGITFTATVTSKTPGTPTPSGQVTLTSSSNPLTFPSTKADLVNGSAQFSPVGGWTTGTYVITAGYTGDASNNGSTGTITIVVDAPPVSSAVDTAIAITINNGQGIQPNQTATITATITQTPRGHIPLGGDFVTFYARASTASDKTQLDKADVTWNTPANSTAPYVGTATIQTGKWARGDYTVEADFFGDIYVNNSSGTVQIGVHGGDPTTTKYSGATTADHGATAQLSAILTDSTGPLSGQTLTLVLDHKASQTCVATTDTFGTAKCPITVSDYNGSYKVDALFAGQGDYQSSSDETDFVVTGQSAPTTVPTQLAYTGDTTGTAGTAEKLQFRLTDTASPANALANEPVTLTIDGAAANGGLALTTDANGYVTLPATLAAGLHSIGASFAGADPYLPSTGTGTVTVNKIPTKTTAAQDPATTYAASATLSGTLLDSSGHPIANQSVALSFGTDSCTGLSDASGAVTCTVLSVTSTPGTYTVTPSYAGNGMYLGSGDPASTVVLGSIVVGQAATTIVDNTTGSFLLGSTATLSGTLSANGKPLPGESLSLSFGGVSCTPTALTDATGTATCQVTVPGPTGPTTTKAAFAGDVNYKAATPDTKPALVYANAPGGGNFVVGDKTATGSVYFWGSQWWKKNILSAGDKQAVDPGAFKGFAANPATPQCGVNWSTNPGNSNPPPNGPLPAYMAVIVTDHNHKAPGKIISGDTVSIVIVKTDAGYQSDPGHPGTGTVVATLCTGGKDDGSSGSGSGSTAIDCKTTKCESLLANPSVAAGATVNPGDTLSILYTDDQPIAAGAVDVTINDTTLAATVTQTTGVKPVYVDSYGGSKATKYQYWITFQIPDTFPSGSYTISVTVQDGDGDYDVYNWPIAV